MAEDLHEQLFYAVQDLHIPLVRVLISKGANVNYRFNCSCIHYINNEGRNYSCTIVGGQGTTYLGFLLHNIIFNHSHSFVYGINCLKTFTLQKQSPLQLYWNMIICLFEYGADPNIPCGFMGYVTSFQAMANYLRSYLNEDRRNFLQKLLEYTINLKTFVSDPKSQILDQVCVCEDTIDNENLKFFFVDIAKKLLVQGAYYPNIIRASIQEVLDWPNLMLFYCLETKCDMVYNSLDFIN